MTLRSDMTVELIDHMGSDDRFAAAARVSTKGTAHAEGGEIAGLISALMRGRHGTPFEHGAMTFRIEAPIFVFREFHRHRVGWSYNEESGRYKTLEPVFYAPSADRPLVQDGKAMSYNFVAGEQQLTGAVRQVLETQCNAAYAAYLSMLASGVAREVARAALPVNTYSSMYATCNPRSLMHFLGLRAAPQAQYEIRLVAEELERIFAMLFPLTHAAWNELGRVAP